MKTLLAPFDGEFKEVLETISMSNRLDIVLPEKFLIETNFVSNRS